MPAPTAPPLPTVPQPLAWAGFLAMCVGMFMAILDIQIVATSLPSIQDALVIRADQMSWIQTSYLIAEVISIPLTGCLTRALSLRWLFVAAASLFVAASLGCASSAGFAELVAWRALQGFAGGMLIPIVFSAALLLFPERGQRLAITFAGMLAVLAPTVGPIVGGWITSTWSWEWLFLVNITPGVAAVVVAIRFLPRDTIRIDDLRRLDIFSLMALAVALASLEIALKRAPNLGWTAPSVLLLIGLTSLSGWIFARRTLASRSPIADLRAFRDRNFALGCATSFILGIGLYGNVYLMPVFLAYVGGLDAFETGQVMLVTGAAQLVAAPLVIWLERHVDARSLTIFGFALFSAGLGLSMFDTPRTGYDSMFWPQIVRGIAIMFALLPPTRIALGHLPAASIPDASALFNLMRNLGGAIGLALIDSVIFGRAERHGMQLAERMLRFEPAAFTFVGLPLPISGTVITEDMKAMARPAVERAALTLAITDAWTLIAAITLLGVLIACAVSRPRSTASGARLSA